MPGKRVIIVKDLKEIHKGTNSAGADYTIWQVLATDQAGNSLDDYNLRTFQELPKHQPIEVEIEKFDHARYGESYTVSTKSGGKRMGNEVRQLRTRVEALEKALGELRSELRASIQNGHAAHAAPPVSTGGPPSQAPQQPPPMQPGGGLPRDDDIPF